MTTHYHTPELLLPWESTGEEDRLFRKVLIASLAVFALAAVVTPLLPLKDIAITDKEQEQTLTRVVLEKKVLPEPAPEPKPRPKPKKVEPAVKPRPPQIAKPAPEPAPVDTLAEARKAAVASGVLAFQDDLQSLRDSVDVDSLNQARTSRGASDAAQLQRSIVTSATPAQSGGIQSSKQSANTGGPTLSGRETTRVRSEISGERSAASVNNQAANTGGRSDEEIRRVMDKNKGAIFSIYNRALRKDPLLEGKLVFEMLIDPSGKIVELKLLSSDLDSADLTQKILSRINIIQFGAAKVVATRVNYSFDFLPFT